MAEPARQRGPARRRHQADELREECRVLHAALALYASLSPPSVNDRVMAIVIGWANGISSVRDDAA